MLEWNSNAPAPSRYRPSPAILRPSTFKSFFPEKRASMPSFANPRTMPSENCSSRSLGRIVVGALVTTATPSWPTPMTIAPPPVGRRPISVPVRLQASMSISASMCWYRPHNATWLA